MWKYTNLGQKRQIFLEGFMKGTFPAKRDNKCFLFPFLSSLRWVSFRIKPDMIFFKIPNGKLITLKILTNIALKPRSNIHKAFFIVLLKK